MKNSRPGLMVKDLKNRKKEWTFFLCYPSTIGMYRMVGRILTEIEKKNLNIIGMRLMCGSSEFITTHFFSRYGRDAFPHRSVQQLARYPFIAMILGGDGAIEKGLQLTRMPTLWGSCLPEAYSSHSYEAAAEDYQIWFGMDSDNWKEEINGSNLAFAFPNCTAIGPTVKVMENIMREQLFISLNPNFVDNFYKKDLSFVLIRPLAFQKGCVGQLISIMESSFSFVEGLKLVRKSEVPHSNAWLANPTIKEDEYGLAMLVRHIIPERIQIIDNGDGRIRSVDNTGKMEICSNLIYLDKPGERSNICAFFEFGAVSWVDPTCHASCGGYFVATLSSLQLKSEPSVKE
ncbi:hypothetical protein MKW94_012045 [Papaver nudicaule]|uniref:Nucleoside diphosphate kinase-like domain-containing protein n=1 Tax=Papaver nudicaule TaxID=74823 RepID=A0AA41VZB2_PAPNU|nr:hypothetical protein [Papaver nudicaule]